MNKSHRLLFSFAVLSLHYRYLELGMRGRTTSMGRGLSVEMELSSSLGLRTFWLAFSLQWLYV